MSPIRLLTGRRGLVRVAGWTAAVLLTTTALSCSANGSHTPGGSHRPAGAAHSDAHGIYPPDRIQWQNDLASLPPGARYAVLEGDPSKPGFFVMRVAAPDGYRIPPHWHPNWERLTIISGTFHLGMGERFDREQAQAMPAGSYSFMPPGMRHFAWCEGETVVQIATMGPWEIHYLDPADDPRRQR